MSKCKLYLSATLQVFLFIVIQQLKFAPSLAETREEEQSDANKISAKISSFLFIRWKSVCVTIGAIVIAHVMYSMLLPTVVIILTREIKACVDMLNLLSDLAHNACAPRFCDLACWHCHMCHLNSSLIVCKYRNGPTSFGEALGWMCLVSQLNEVVIEGVPGIMPKIQKYASDTQMDRTKVTYFIVTLRCSDYVLYSI